MIHGMNHFTVIAHDLDETLAYYVDLLGLRRGPRPDLGFDGAWLYAGDQAILHIYADRAVPQPPAGVIDHMAFSARDLAAVQRRFDDRGWPYDLRQQKDSGTWQLFSHDPNGARVELDFDPQESPA